MEENGCESSLTPWLPIRMRVHDAAAPHPPLLSGGQGPRGHSLPNLLIEPASASSPASAEWTTDSTGPGFDISRSVSRTLTGGPYWNVTSPECPCTTTYEIFRGQMGGHPTNGMTLREDESFTLDQHAPFLLTSSQEEVPVKTSASPDSGADSKATAPDSSSSTHESLTLFDPDGSSGRTFLVPSLARAVGTSEQSLERWPTSGTAWPGGFSTHVSSECRSAAAGCSSSEPSLTEILEPPQNVPAKYSLSARAALGILRRAEKRGRILPGHLAAALESVAGHRTSSG